MFLFFIADNPVFLPRQVQQRISHGNSLLELLKPGATGKLVGNYSGMAVTYRRRQICHECRRDDAKSKSDRYIFTGQLCVAVIDNHLVSYIDCLYVEIELYALFLVT